MEYRNNWPTYLQEKKSPVKAVVVEPSYGICVGGGSDSNVNKLDIALARAECNRKAKVENSVLQIDTLMGKLIHIQRSSNLNKACMARKAAAELASERKRLAFLCERLKKLNAQDVRKVMAIENRKAISMFKAKWANLLGGVV